MPNKSLDKILAEMIVQYWISAIKAYADQKAASIFRSGNDNKLSEEKHLAAKRFVVDLTAGFVTDDSEPSRAAKRQSILAKKQMKKVLLELVHPHIIVSQQRREKQKLMQDERSLEIQRTASALSSTPITPLFLKRKDTMPSPTTENSGIDLSDHMDRKDLFNELSAYVVYEIHEISCLRKQYRGFYSKEHPPGNYDGLLRVLYENISFAIIKAREFGLSSKTDYYGDSRQQALLNIVLFLCMLDFDRRIQNNVLIWSSQKRAFSIQSGFMLNSMSVIRNVELNLNIMLFRLFCDTITSGDDWVNINTLGLYLKLETILTELQKIYKIPEKFINSMQQIMRNVQDSYIAHGPDEFEKKLEELRRRYDELFDESRPIRLPDLPIFIYKRTISVGSEDMRYTQTPHTTTRTEPPTPLISVL